VSTNLPVLLILVFGSASLLIMGVYYAVIDKKRDLGKRLKDMQDRGRHTKQNTAGGVPVSQQALSALSRAAVKFRPFNKLSRILDKTLAGADIPLKSEEYILLSAGLSFLAGILVYLIALNAQYGLIAALCTSILSVTWIKMAKTRRLSRFEAQIGDALVIMANSLRSGFSFLQAMDMVRKELPNPIAIEFGRTFQEMNLGTPTEEALENLDNRIGSEDLGLVITAVLIQRQVGGNLAGILDNIAGTIRERVRIKGEIRTLTAQGKISGVIIGILPIILAAVMYIISPDYLMPLISERMGLGMLVSALLLEAAGIIIIRKIIDIKI